MIQMFFFFTGWLVHYNSSIFIRQFDLIIKTFLARDFDVDKAEKMLRAVI